MKLILIIFFWSIKCYSQEVVLTSTLLTSYAGASRVLYLTDTLQGGMFYYSTATKTVDNGIVFAATGKGSGYWVRVYDNANGVNIDWFGGRTEKEINKASVAAGINGIINFTPGKLYTQRSRILPKLNQMFNGNGATLKRGNDSVVDLLSTTLPTDSAIYLNAIPLFWTTGGGYIHMFTDSTDFCSSKLISISSIFGNTIKLRSNVGALSNPNSEHPQITEWEPGTKVHYVYNQFDCYNNNISINNLTFDGNKANNNENHSWRINAAIINHGNGGQAVIEHCAFYNMPNENIVGHGFHIINNYAHNLNGSFVHTSSNPFWYPIATPSIISGNITDSTNLVQDIVGAHSEGCITYSTSSGFVNIVNNRFKNGGDAVFGVIQSGNDPTNQGVRDMLISNNYAQNFQRIFYSNLANPVGLLWKYGHIFISENIFNNCGLNDWTIFQTGINNSDIVMVGNNLLVGGTVWKIPIQNSDSLQRYILNNSTATQQVGSINLKGTIKSGQ